MQTLDEFLSQGWADHADHAAAVAARLPQGLALAKGLDAATQNDGVTRLAGLAHHVFGEHLGQWDVGQDFMVQLGALGLQDPAAASIARCQASLRFCADAAAVDALKPLSISDQCRVSSMAACNLAGFDEARASALLDAAVAQANPLPDADPAVRALAANSNNMAGTLQDAAKHNPASLSAPRRALMLHAAQIACVQWARAGTWLEVERAEYRLALCWLAAGDAAKALQHGQRCESVILENGSVPLELFFACEVVGLPAHALGDTAKLNAAVATARLMFDALSVDDQAWCRVTLDALNALVS